MTSVVVPVYNGADLLAETVPAVLDLREVTECVWVDDGSTDATAAVLRRLTGGRPGVRVVTLSQNAGRAAARNAGVAACSGEAVVFLDADVEPPPGAAAALAAAALAPGAVASVARQRPVADRPADPYQDYAVHYPRGPRPDASPGAVLDWRYFVTGACAVRRAAFRQAGGFSEGVAYGEDVALAADLARRAPHGLRLADAAVRVHGVGDIDDALCRAAQFGRSLGALAGTGSSVEGLVRLRPFARPAGLAAGVLDRAVRRLGPGPVRRSGVRYLLATTMLAASRDG